MANVSTSERPPIVLTKRDLDDIATLGKRIPYFHDEDIRGYAVDIRQAIINGDNDLAYQLSRELTEGNAVAAAGAREARRA
jgi:hypothetical protein